jgi:hypothetical protein
MKGIVEFLTEAKHHIDFNFDDLLVTSTKQILQADSMEEYLQLATEENEDYDITEDCVLVDTEFEFISRSTGESWEGELQLEVRPSKRTIELNQWIFEPHGDASILDSINTQNLQKEIKNYLSVLGEPVKRFKVNLTVDDFK